MIPRETQLDAALRANAALRIQAERLIAALSRRSSRPVTPTVPLGATEAPVVAE